MLETPHVLVGAAIASKIPNPLLSIPLSFASHFILDMLPHWNPHINTETKKYGKPRKSSVQIIITDGVLALVSGSMLAFSSPDQAQTINVLACCFAAVLPDLIEAPYFFLSMKTKFILAWIKFQKSIQNDADIVPGLLTQLAMTMASLWWFFS